MDIQVGSCFRQCFADGSAAAFSDAIVVKVYTFQGETYCNLVRPFVLTESLSLDAERLEHVPSKSLGTKYWKAVKR